MSNLAIVFQIGSLGDSVVSVPALLSLRELLPSCSEYLLVSNLDSHLKVAPNQVFDMAWKGKGLISYNTSGNTFRRVASQASLIAQLRYYRPRYCVYLAPADRSPRQSKRDELFFRAGGCKELIGFRSLTSEELSAEYPLHMHRTEAYLRFRRVWDRPAEETFLRYAATPLLEPDTEAKQSVRTWLGKTRRAPGRRIIALCPYSNWPSRNIPANSIVQLISQLHLACNAEVVVLGGKKDFDQARMAIRVAGSGINACGMFSISESAALLGSCALAVCTESGPMHLAGAVGTPSVIVFSRTNKQLGRWFPLGSHHTILYREPACAGCSAIDCAVAGHPCMSEITVDQILSAVHSRLSGLNLAPRMFDGTKALVA
jgi:ADP-heptose:LPS heptosyltransferase